MTDRKLTSQTLTPWDPTDWQWVPVAEPSGTADAPLRYCTRCGRPEHGSITCHAAAVLQPARVIEGRCTGAGACEAGGGI